MDILYITSNYINNIKFDIIILYTSIFCIQIHDRSITMPHNTFMVIVYCKEQYDLSTENGKTQQSHHSLPLKYLRIMSPNQK